MKIRCGGAFRLRLHAPYVFYPTTGGPFRETIPRPLSSKDEEAARRVRSHGPGSEKNGAARTPMGPNKDAPPSVFDPTLCFSVDKAGPSR